MTRPYETAERPYRGPRLCRWCATPLDPILDTDPGQKDGVHPNCAAAPNTVPAWLRAGGRWLIAHRPEALTPWADRPPEPAPTEETDPT